MPKKKASQINQARRLSIMVRLIACLLAIGVTGWYLTRNRTERIHSLISVSSPGKLPAEPQTKDSNNLPNPRKFQVANPLPSSSNSEPFSPFQTGEKADWRTLPLLSAFRSSKTWNHWLCADVEGTPSRSLWRLQDDTDETIKIYNGSCEEWQKQAPPSSME